MRHEAVCPACGAALTGRVDEIAGYQQGTSFPVTTCFGCGTVTSPGTSVPDGLYDSIYSHGRELQGYYRYWGYAAASATLRWPLHYLACSEEMYWGVQQVLRRRAAAGLGTRVLEVGCGLGYLAAALSTTRPWLGHKYNTPRFDDRQTKLAAFKSTTTAGDLLGEVDLALTSDPRIIRRLQDEDWQHLTTHGPLQLWQKP